MTVLHASIRAVRSGSARVRLDAVRSFLESLNPGVEVLIVGATRGAADDCARAIAAARGVSFGLHRLSLLQAAARLAMPALAAHARTPIAGIGFEALAARATFDADNERTLDYLAAVHAAPGFPRALAATLTELRLHRGSAEALKDLDRSGPDLSNLLRRVEAWLDAAGASDRASLFDAAIAALPHTTEFAGLPVVLLDPAFDSAMAAELLLGLAARASSVLVTLADGDVAAARALGTASIAIEDRHDDRDIDLTRLQRHLFSESPPPPRERTGEMVWLSAPGEARECVEIARRVLAEAARGVPFDEMAVLLRSPQQYVGLIEHAFDRAGIAAHFDRGTRKPDPAGRAFLALIACAAERLSARRFAEYLSLGQVPVEDRAPDDAAWLVAEDEGLGLVVPDDEVETVNGDARAHDDESTARPRVSAPWRWERLLVESSVIGGADRWERRLEGLAGLLRTRRASLEADDPDDPKVDRLAREIEDLRDLQAYAMPLVHEMAGWPDRASWGDWIATLDAFAVRVLRQPDRVRQLLAEFRPMGSVGPVSLSEVRDVLAERLSALHDAPSGSRYGRVFVAGIDEARGRAFRVVFVPGLAERLFPRAVREDPLLVDDLRRRLGGLIAQNGRADLERLSLRLAVGAATDRIYVSFPRLDATGGRARVPSFYALELMRAATGVVPDSALLQEQAAESSGAALAWPAPRNPDDAVDDFEHDLSVLRALMQDGAAGKGRAQYIVQLNPHLRRSLTSQWQRARALWTSSDGLVKADGDAAAFLATQRLSARPYSVSALQNYSACPYRFLLSAVYRLAPIDEPEALQRIDPITRGSFMHRVQADLFRALDAESLLPPRPERQDRIRQLLDGTIARVAREFADELAPAIDRVWRDEIAAITRDLYVWIEQVVHDEQWEPWRFELAFGLAEREGHDARSRKEPAVVDGRFTLRGSIDLVEKRRGGDALRVTDYKTSRNRLQKKVAVVGGGAILQPVLYSLAVEATTAARVESARLWFCTAAGGFSEHVVPMTEAVRRQGLEVLEIVDRAVELGVFPAAPGEKACERCDVRRACGPDEERRTRLKSRDLLGDLIALREMK
jgi:CRISPR/Cas system-associated exonuclease Cas4 (RecB family)